MVAFLLQEAVEPPTKPSNVEEWKEINLTIRHWETLVFENSKSLFTAVTIAIGAAGAVVAWATVGLETQRIVVTLFLGAATALSLAAIAVILSTKAYLGGFYRKREALQDKFRQLADAVNEAGPDDPIGIVKRIRNWLFKKQGWTLPALASCFVLTIVLCAVFFKVTWSYEPERSLLNGARLQGADLSTVSGLNQRDLANACGDSKTKLPVGLVLPYCEQLPIPPATETGVGAKRPTEPTPADHTKQKQ